MKIWLTEINAVDPETGVLDKWAGHNIPGISKSDAQEYCYTNALGYCTVIGQLIKEMPVSKDTSQYPETDYDIINNN